MTNIIEFELLDMLEKIKNFKYLRLYIKRLCDNKDSINVKEYLLKKVNSKTVLEIIAREWDKLNVLTKTDTLKSILLSDPELLEECIKIRFLKILKDAPINIFETKIQGISLIEYLFKNNHVYKKYLDILLPCPNIFYYIKKYNKEDLLENVNLNKLLIKPKNGKLYLDEFIESGIQRKMFFIDIELVEEIIKRKQYHMLYSLLEDGLLRKIGNETILEILLKENHIPNIKEYKKEESIKILAKYSKYEILQNTCPSDLLIKQEDGKYIIEELLEKNLSLAGEIFADPNVVYYIIKHKRIDLYDRIHLKTLITNGDLNNKFLDIILNQASSDNKIHIPTMKDIHSSGLTHREIAQIYICYAKHGFEKELPKYFSPYIMMDEKRKKTLLEYLLEEDEQITTEKIINHLINMDVIKLIVKVYEYKKQFPNVEQMIETLSQEQLKEYKVEKVDEEVESLIDELIFTFSDEYKDNKALELIRINYTYLCMQDKMYMNEVKRLIELKQAIPHLTIALTRDGNYYKGERVSLTEQNIYALNHELGHLFFHMNAQGKLPQNFDSVVFKLSNDKDFIENRIVDFSRKANHALSEASDEAQKLYERFIEPKELQKEYIDEIREYLQTTALPNWLFNSIKQDTLDITVEEYLEKDKKIKQRMIKNKIMESKNPGLLIVSDIIDAICEGTYFDGFLLDKNGVQIRAIGGHGTRYFARNKVNMFNEMIANYNSLLKLKDSEEYILLLRQIVGNELVDLLDEYYNENIIMHKEESHIRR